MLSFHTIIIAKRNSYINPHEQIVSDSNLFEIVRDTDAQDIYKLHWNILHKQTGVTWNVGP